MLKEQDKAGKAELRTFSKPNEVRGFPKAKRELIKIGGATTALAIFEPGWRWSTSVKPIVNTKSCEAPTFRNMCRRRSDA